MKVINPDSIVGYAETFVNPVELAEYILVNEEQFTENSKIFIHQLPQRYVDNGDIPVVKQSIIENVNNVYVPTDSSLIIEKHLYLSIL